MVSNVIVNEIKNLIPSFNNMLVEEVDRLSPYATDPKLYKFMSWAIDNNWNNDPTLMNDVVCLPNARLEGESFEEYKSRRILTRYCKKYRKYFIDLMIDKNGWDKKEKN